MFHVHHLLMSTVTGKGHRRRRDADYGDETNGLTKEQTETNGDTKEQTETNGDTNKTEQLAKDVEKVDSIEDARKASRAAYLQNRFESKVAALERELEASRSKNLSPREAEEYRQKQEIVNSIRAGQNAPLVSEYELPSEHSTLKRKRDLLQTAEPTEKDKKNRFENQWELDQLKKAQVVGTNTDEIQLPNQQQYEFVFDESQFVDFADEAELPGEEVPEAPKRDDSEIQSVRKSLPVYGYREQFLEAIDKNQVLIVVGETGSGKTTQLPQYLYEAGYTKKDSQLLKVGCTQPRRVAATSVAARVADEVGCTLGEEVGYSIRFEDRCSDKTEIKYLTDGMLLREFLTDPLLSTYSALMIDEAHERTVSTEIILSLLKDIIKERKDLKLIVASATINASKFSDYFSGSPIFNIPGRRFPVDIAYTKNPEANYIQAAITTIFQIHTTQESKGDILVFLTGQEEIETMEETLNEACQKLGSLIKNLIVAPIYANLPPSMQKKIFEPTPPDSRKVVLATNIAETSITIEGIKYVIDPGYVKENVFNPTTGMESLVVVPCSRASADQRAGRAGRVGPGKCYRLYTKWSFYNELQANPTPEILRVNLGTVVLLLLSMGITDLVHFDFMDPPSLQTLIKSLELLYALGALNAKGDLTETGRKMAEFPMDPMFGKCLIASAEFGVTKEILSIMAMLSEASSLFFRPKDKRTQADQKKEAFEHEAGDHLTLLNIWDQWSETGFSNIWCEDNFLQYRTLKRAKDVRTQLERLCTRVGIDVEHLEKSANKLVKIQKALVSGFFPNVARMSKMGTSYVLLKKNQPVYIHPSSCLFSVKPPPRLVMHHELVLTSKEYMRNCMRIQEKWLDELAPHYYHGKELESLKGRR